MCIKKLHQSGVFLLPLFILHEENVSTQSFVFIAGFTVGVLKFIIFGGSGSNDFLCLEDKVKCTF